MLILILIDFVIKRNVLEKTSWNKKCFSNFQIQFFPIYTKIYSVRKMSLRYFLLHKEIMFHIKQNLTIAIQKQK